MMQFLLKLFSKTCGRLANGLTHVTDECTYENRCEPSSLHTLTLVWNILFMCYLPSVVKLFLTL